MIRRLIAFRKTHWVLRLLTLKQIHKHVQIYFHQNNSLVYGLNSSGYCIQVIVNPNHANAVFENITPD